MNSSSAFLKWSAALGSIGYQNELVRQNYEFSDFQGQQSLVRKAPIAAFSEYPTSYRNSCLGVVYSDSTRFGAKWVHEHRALGAPLIFEVRDDTVQPWSIGFNEAKHTRAAFALSDLGEVFHSNGDIWKPEELSRVKSALSPNTQLNFFDANLLPQLEEFFQPRLKDVLERSFVQIEDCFQNVHGQNPNIEQLFNYLFRFVTAKIFQDRGDVEGWTDLTDPLVILQKATAHSGLETGTQLPSTFLDPRLLNVAWKSVSTTLNFQNFFVPEVAFIYEEAFINAKTRKELGIHSTPERLVNYIVEHLPWEQIDIEQRRVFEPFCGHGIFLASSLERLKRDVADVTPEQRHDYFRRMLVGVEKDALALEVCRLMLTLSDYPNNNSWNLNRADVFDWPQWDQTLASAGAVLANPPYESFGLQAKKRKSLGLRKAEPPAEMLFRLLRQPPPLLGLVLPYSFLNGPSYREANRQIAERYEAVSLVELPRIFRYADNQTVALMASGRRQEGTSVSVSFAEVHKDNLQEFWDKGTVSNARTATLKIEDRAFSLRVAPQDSISQWLPASLPKLSSLATIRKGINWLARSDGEKIAEPRTDVASDALKEGFMLGAEKMKGNLSQFRINNLRCLSLNEKDQSPKDKAWKLEWERPKVVCNAGRRGQGSPWRIAAWADESGLAFTKQFFAIWPNDGVSIFAIAAVLCSPVANSLIWETDRGRDNRKSTLEKLPFPTKDKLGTNGPLHRQAQELQRLLTPGEFSIAPSNEQITEALMRLDATILDAYELSAQAQRFLLDQFQAYKRPVSVPFHGYFPDGFSEAVTLSDYIAVKYDWEKHDERRCEMIEKNIAENSLTVSQIQEMERLQWLADLWLAIYNPQPTAALDAMIEQLKSEGKWLDSI